MSKLQLTDNSEELQKQSKHVDSRTNQSKMATTMVRGEIE